MSRFAGLALPVDQPARMIISTPDEGGTLRNRETGEDAWIDLLSADSEVARAHDRALRDRIMRHRRPLSSDEAEQWGTDLLAKLTRGWSLVTLDGEPIDLPFSEAAARELYAMPELRWLRDQIDRFVADRGNWVRRARN